MRTFTTLSFLLAASPALASPAEVAPADQPAAGSSAIDAAAAEQDESEQDELLGGDEILVVATRIGGQIELSLCLNGDTTAGLDLECESHVPQGSFAPMRAALEHARLASTPEQIAYEAQVQAARVSSEDFRAALAAFTARRRP